jgi:hypothetical protein
MVNYPLVGLKFLLYHHFPISGAPYHPQRELGMMIRHGQFITFNNGVKNGCKVVQYECVWALFFWIMYYHIKTWMSPSKNSKAA